MIILLHGPDTYRSKERLRQLLEAFRKKYDPSRVNVTTFTPENFDLEAFRRSAGSAGFLAKRRMVTVEHLLSSPKSKSAPEELIEDFSADKFGDNIIVFLEGDLGERRDRKKRRAAPRGGPLLAWLLEHAKVEEFSLLTGESLNRWIGKEVKRQDGRIESPAILELAALIGSDLWQMSSEIAKLVAYSQGTSITATVVREFVHARYDENIFHLTDALAEKDERRSAALLGEQLAAGSHPLYLLTMLTRQFRILLLVKEVLNAEQHPATVASRLKLHPFVAQKAIREARRFDMAELKEIFVDLLDLDLKLKTSQGDPLTLLTLFVHRVCRGLEQNRVPVRRHP